MYPQIYPQVPFPRPGFPSHAHTLARYHEFLLKLELNLSRLRPGVAIWIRPSPACADAASPNSAKALIRVNLRPPERLAATLFYSRRNRHRTARMNNVSNTSES